MTILMERLRGAGRIAAATLIMAALGGCASATKTTTTSTPTAGASSSMPGMNMGNTGGGMTVAGIKPIPTQTLATATWQSMKVSARAMTAVPFVVYNGTSEHLVKPGKNTTFHLMVDLNDIHTGVAIPYASVWATIRRGGRIVYDERLWPMISEYMGPHYGNDVALPGPGTYQLSLLISPPVSARHVEYRKMWLAPHRITTSFTWKSPA